MNLPHLCIDELRLFEVTDTAYLKKHIYPNMAANYYYSYNYSAEFYIAAAKAGFIAVTESFKDIELLIPEIQYDYALLDFKDLHISRKVKKLLKSNRPTLTISHNLDDVFNAINKAHKNSWLTPKYLQTLKECNLKNDNFKAISVAIYQDNILISGEIGYIIGNTYTSLSGFSKKKYNNYGKLQLVMLAKYLEQNNFAFWNLGHPHMSYKLALGAKVYTRAEFLKRWIKETTNPR